VDRPYWLPDLSLEGMHRRFVYFLYLEGRVS
jgi:hypothetical protein